MGRITAENKEEYFKQLQEKAIKETDEISKKQRFGLFSQPPPLAIGENSADQKIIPPKDASGKPITKQRNLLAGSCVGIKTKDFISTKVGYATIGNLYYDPDRYDKMKNLEEKKKYETANERAPFRPSDRYKTIAKPPYPYKEEGETKSKNYGSDGKYVNEKPNVISGIALKKERVNYNPITNSYEPGKEKFLKELERHRGFIKEKGQFKTWGAGNKIFNSDSETYGLKTKLPEKKQFEPHLNILKHEAPFIPSNPPKQGYNSCIGKFPKYQEDPPIPKVRKIVDEKDKRENFKPTYNGLSRPTPSITLNRINIKRSAGGRLL